MEHFEQLWNEAESLVKIKYENSLSLVVKNIKNQLDLLVLTQEQNDKIKILGSILLDITYLSEKFNINTFYALKDKIEELKLEMYDPD